MSAMGIGTRKGPEVKEKHLLTMKHKMQKKKPAPAGSKPMTPGLKIWNTTYEPRRPLLVAATAVLMT